MAEFIKLLNPKKWERLDERQNIMALCGDALFITLWRSNT